jgi:hypothetical protein
MRAMNINVHEARSSRHSAGRLIAQSALAAAALLASRLIHATQPRCTSNRHGGYSPPMIPSRPTGAALWTTRLARGSPVSLSR